MALTVNDVQYRKEKAIIRAEDTGDDYELSLLAWDVIRAIAQGHPDPQTLAKAALEGS